MAADLQHYEFVVTQKVEGKWRMRRILCIIGYILFAATFFILGTTTKLLFPLLALTPLFLWMLVFITWRYTRPEYAITTESNKLSFTILYGRTRRPQFAVEFRHLQRIAPLDDDGKIDIRRFAPEKVYTAVSSMDSARDIYFAIWEDDDKVPCVLYFEATEHLLKICRYYNSANTVVTPVSR